MNALIHSTSLLAAMAASTLISAIWQGTILAICVYLCLRMFPGMSAAARSVVWMNVFLALVVLHFLPLVLARGNQTAAGHSTPLNLGWIWSLAIAALWVGLSLSRAAQLVSSAVRLHVMARRATPLAADEALRGLLEIRPAGGKSRRSAELCISDEVQRPSVLGFFRPRILLPPGLMERLTPEELKQVVLHEMEHLRRADDWTNLLQKIALVILPLNPALLWVEHRLCAERELACDDSVMRSINGRKAYAVCLTRLAEHSMLRRGVSLALGAWERQSELVRRVHRILRRPNEAMSRRRTIALAGSLIAGVLICSAGLARSPQLVSFAEPVQNDAQVLPATDFSASSVDRFAMPAHAQLAKAVMPERLQQSPFAPAPMAKTQSAARPVAKNAVIRSVKRHSAPQQQAWVVMTEWSSERVSSQLVLTVAKTQRVPAKVVKSDDGFSYAAVPLPNGWLFVQI
jgi:beta-lactamase regulating signal transducer with metallopeptidase domain